MKSSESIAPFCLLCDTGLWIHGHVCQSGQVLTICFILHLAVIQSAFTSPLSHSPGKHQMFNPLAQKRKHWTTRLWRDPMAIVTADFNNISILTMHLPLYPNQLSTLILLKLHLGLCLNCYLFPFGGFPFWFWKNGYFANRQLNICNPNRHFP